MKKDLYLSGLFFLFILFASFYLSTRIEVDFGAEYACIAESIYRGHGFSNPFCSPEGYTQSTAWMPPFLSYLQAGVYSLFGLYSVASVYVLLFISKAVLALCLFMLLRLANEVNSRYRHMCILFFSAYILINPKAFLLSFHDVWLIATASMAVPYVLYFHFVKQSLPFTAVLFVALLLPLISPILSFAFVCVTVFLFLRNSYLHWRNSGSFQQGFGNLARLWKYVTIAFAFSIPLLLWGGRNYIVFNKFIPVKSNLWFDFYQANVYDEDGLITGFTFANFHPIKNKSRLKDYLATGELELMEKHKEESLNYLSRQPADFLSKIQNRAAAAFVFSKHPYDEDFKINNLHFADSDLLELRSRKIVSASNSLNMQIDREVLISRISGLNKSNESRVVAAWQDAKDRYTRQFYSPVRIIESLMISGIPFMAWLAGAFLIRNFRRAKELFMIITVLYLSYFLPYIGISIHTRYQLPFSPVFCLLIFFALIMVINKIKPGLLKA